MLKINKRYIVDDHNRPVEVILDVATFEKIEAALEDHLFRKLLRQVAKKEPLSLDRAKALYARMKKRT